MAVVEFPVWVHMERGGQRGRGHSTPAELLSEIIERNHELRTSQVRTQSTLHGRRCYFRGTDGTTIGWADHTRHPNEFGVCYEVERCG